MDLYSNRNNFLRVFNRSQRQWEIKFGRKFQKLRKSRDGQWKTRVNGAKNQAANLTAHCTKKKKKYRNSNWEVNVHYSSVVSCENMKCLAVDPVQTLKEKTHWLQSLLNSWLDMFLLSSDFHVFYQRERKR